MPNRIAAFLHIPHDILGWLGLQIASVMVLAAGAVESFLPTPDVAGSWSFYGVLIVAIIALALSLAMVIRWVAVKWMQQQKDTNGMLARMTEVIEKQNDNLIRQIEWFEAIAQNSIQQSLADAARMSLHEREKQRARQRERGNA